MAPPPLRSTLRPAVLAAVLAAGCDFSPALDIETPAHEPRVVLRAVLAAGAPPTVRVSLSRDPYGLSPRDRLPSETPAGAVVTLRRDGGVVETLAARPQTCHRQREAACNPATGVVESRLAEPYECGAFVGAAPIEAGATYTLHAELPGLPPAEATVAVPARPEFRVDEMAGEDETRRFRVHLDDAPGAGSRYGIAIHREFDSYTASVCAVGGYRDTTVTLPWPARYQTRFATTEPALLTNVGEPSGAGYFFTFTDATFEGGAFAFSVEVPAEDGGARVASTGRFIVQLAALSAELFDAYQLTYFALGDDNPFTEPINLPTNVEGGYGRVGAVAAGEVDVPPRPGG